MSQAARRASATAQPLVYAVLAALAMTGLARAADHGDHPVAWDVVAGLDLAEGPPYPTTPVEVDARFGQPPQPVIPAGRLLLTLANAEGGAAGSPIAITSSFADNGDPFGEPGDTLIADVFFIPAAPPDDEYPFRSIVSWKLHTTEASDTSVYEFTSGEPLTLELDLFFDAYFQFDLRNLVTQEVRDTVRLHVHIAVTPGQGLRIENASATPPDAQSQAGLRFELNHDGSGDSVDPATPLYRIIVTGEEILPIPSLPPMGGALMGALLLLAGARRLARQRATSPPVRVS